MLGRVKFALLLLTLSCTEGGEVTGDPSALDPAELSRNLAQQERERFEGRIRLTVYHECGGDAELRCQQFGPRSLRGIPPTIPMRVEQCQESGVYPKRLRDCAFSLGHEGGRTITCRLMLREVPGPHSPYWSDQLPPPIRAATPSPALPDVPAPRSSLACKGSLLSLTGEPEKVDPAPAIPSRLLGKAASLISEDDYPIPAMTGGARGIVTMKLQVGSHGRIDRCEVTRSSGSKGLDDRTCELLRSRATFVPARSTRGEPVAAETSHSHDWKQRIEEQ
jgi:TonB family protein